MIICVLLVLACFMVWSFVVSGYYANDDTPLSVGMFLNGLVLGVTGLFIYYLILK